MPWNAFFFWINEDKSYYDPKTETGRDFIGFYKRMNMIRLNFDVPDDYVVTYWTFWDIWWLQIRLYLSLQIATLMLPSLFIFGLFI